jgi:putative serine protease PepD
MGSSSRSRVRGFVLRRFLPSSAALVAVAAVAAIAAACTSSSTPATARVAIGSQPGLQAQYERVVRRVLPSVVQITTVSSTGSGVVYDTHGDIVTNEHVIGTAKTVQIRDAAGNKELTANVVGVFGPDDLAVVRVTQDADTLKPASFGNSDDAEIGEIVLAMGNPLGLIDSAAQGIISATGRTVGDASGALITAAIQTSAAINPGNSGGALVDLQDQVIGIPTLAATLPGQGGAAPGIGFAIPSNTVINIANQLIKSGKVTNSDRATLGIIAQTSANQDGEPVGVAVVEVPAGSAGASAGLQEGDLIVGINDEHVDTVQDLEGVLATLKPGSEVTIHYTRDGSNHTTSAKLGSLAS